MTQLPAFEDFYEAHPELFDHSPDHAIRSELATDWAQAEGRIRVPPVERESLLLAAWPPAFVDLRDNQTSIKSQGSRSTCYAFAAVAGLEAAYRRQHGVVLDLSEQYAFHMNKGTELVGNYTMTTRPESNSSMWGFQGCSDIVDRMARSAIPDEAVCPYLDDPDMQNVFNTLGISPLTDTSSQADMDLFEFDQRHIPLGARYACRYQVKAFSALPGNPAPADIEPVLASGHECVVDIPGHCILLVGYDRASQVYLIKDSANPNGFQTYSYASPILGGRYITEVHPPDRAPERGAMWWGRWNIEYDGWRGELVIRRNTDYHQTAPGMPTKLGNLNINGQSFDVNGELLEDGRVAHFWVAGTTARVTPGAKDGQEYWVYLFDHDPANAAGYTLYEGTQFGVTLSRWELPAQSDARYESWSWVGNWAMSHDGWQGQLRLDGWSPAQGVYSTGGRNFVATGHHDGFALDLDAFGFQRFRLMMHTHNTDMASGTTVYDGRTYGVHLRRLLTPVEPPVTPHNVPPVVGTPAAEAYATLQGAGYAVEHHWEWSSGEPEGNISGQSPEGGAPDLPPGPVHIWERTLPPEPVDPGGGEELIVIEPDA